MRYILSLMVIPFFMIYAHAGYLNFPIDDLQNLKLSCQVLEKIFAEKTEDSFYLDNPEFFKYGRVKIDVLASKIDLKNHVRAFKALMTKEKLAGNDFKNALMKGIISLNQIDSGDWEIALKDTTSRRKTTFKLTNLSGGDNPFGISIILPTFNRITECTACVLLLKARILAPKNLWEVIVVDDGCTDGTGAYLTEFFKNKGFENFRVIYTDKEPGKYRNVGWPRNSGLKAARYSHVATCDSDIYHLCDPVTPSLDVLSKDPETVIFGNLYCVSGPASTQCFVTEKFDLKPYPWSDTCESGWFLLKRKTYIDLGGNTEQIKSWGCEDTDLIERLQKSGKTFTKINSIIYTWAYEVETSYKANRAELQEKQMAILRAHPSILRNEEKPDWGKYYLSPPYPQATPDFSKVN